MVWCVVRVVCRRRGDVSQSSPRRSFPLIQPCPGLQTLQVMDDMASKFDFGSLYDDE